MNPLSVLLVHHPGKADPSLAGRMRMRGSDVMRGPQLAAMLGPLLPPRYALRAVPLPLDPGERQAWIGSLPLGVVILLKNAALALSPHETEAIARRSLALGLDPIDADLAALSLGEPFSFVLSASMAGDETLRALARVPVHLLLHHADPRLSALGPPPQDKLKAIYLGYPPNLLLPPALFGRVEVLPIRFADELDALLPQIARANCHVACRPRRAGAGQKLKPFTKGVTAAACGAPVIVNRDAADATTLLGADYPYLVDGVDEADVIAVFERASEGFGSSEWQLARSRMAELRSRIRPDTLARTFAETLMEVTG